MPVGLSPPVVCRSGAEPGARRRAVLYALNPAHGVAISLASIAAATLDRAHLADGAPRACSSRPTWTTHPCKCCLATTLKLHTLRTASAVTKV
jgi:hypothetical protein